MGAAGVASFASGFDIGSVEADAVVDTPSASSARRFFAKRSPAAAARSDLRVARAATLLLDINYALGRTTNTQTPQTHRTSLN